MVQKLYYMLNMSQNIAGSHFFPDVGENRTYRPRGQAPALDSLL